MQIINPFEFFLIDIQAFNDHTWQCCEKCIVLTSLYDLIALQVVSCHPPLLLASMMLFP